MKAKKKRQCSLLQMRYNCLEMFFRWLFYWNDVKPHQGMKCLHYIVWLYSEKRTINIQELNRNELANIENFFIRNLGLTHASS